MTSAAERWREELAGWAIPDEILAAAPESPWGFPPHLWRAGVHEAAGAGAAGAGAAGAGAAGAGAAGAGAAGAGAGALGAHAHVHLHETSAPTPSTRRALEALPAGGTVLDVGCGGGRASFALADASPAGGLSLTGLDELPAMLVEFEAAAEARKLPHRTVLGTWPEMAPGVEPADVVICHHVAYNVPDLVPFVQALSGNARRRVVLELTDRHPLVELAPLWQRFHGLERPSGPTAELALEALGEAGIAPSAERHDLGPSGLSRDSAVAFTRRRLCLPASRDPEVDAAMGPDWGARRTVVTIWWSPAD